MNDLNKSSTGKDSFLVLIILLVTGICMYSTYWMALATPVKVMVWIGWLVVFSLLSYFTSKGQQVWLFFNEAKIELQKVVWPNRQETVQTTTIVMIMVSVMGFILWAIDSLMMTIIAKITHLG